jgi:septal ring factor EnvC (AmiA/AmiB activator)
MRNPFTYLRELHTKLALTHKRLIEEITRADKLQKELSDAKATIKNLHLDIHTTKTYTEVLENTIADLKESVRKDNLYDELDIPKK